MTHISISLLIASTLVAPSFFHAQSSREDSSSTDKCNYWHARVDPDIKLVGKNKKPLTTAEPILKELQKNTLKELRDEKKVVEAITCLLQLEGNKKQSNITGATSYTTSQSFGTSTIEVAALYYISYMYYEKWDHGGAAELVNDKGPVKDDETIHKVYEAYRAWFDEVKRLGLKKARQENMNPLKGTGIYWYGNS